MPSLRVNLQTTSFATPWIAVPPGATKLSASVNDASGFTWGNAVLALQWSVEVGRDENGILLDDPQAFDPAVTFVTATRSRRAIGISGTDWVRFKTTTPGSTSDPSAILTYRFH